MRFFSLFLALAFLWPATVFADNTDQCANYQMHLEGVNTSIPGHQYKEILEMHKVGSSPGYDGKWKVDHLVQIIVYPTGGPAMPDMTGMRVDFGMGTYMICDAHVVDNVIVSDCSGGNLHFDVSRNRIGTKEGNIWPGSIQGNKAKYRFDPNNPLSPWLTGEIRKPAGKTLKIDITAPTKNRFVYSDADVGVVEMEFKARTSPAEYEPEIEWIVPEIEGAKRIMVPESGRGPVLKVRYEGLPEDNSQFGPKTVTASVNVGGCQVETEKTVNIFYPRDAANNPGGEHPNWFYYWKQTPAAQPRGQTPRILWGGTSYKECPQPPVAAEFVPGDGHATIYVCSLTKFGPDFRLDYPLLSFKPPYFKKWMVSRHIDTFAVAIIHEYTHWEVWHGYFYGKSDKWIADNDKDQDGLPDTSEPQYGFSPKKYQTHLANHPKLKDIDGDEEYLCFHSMGTIPPGSLDKYDWGKPGKQWP